jgi:transposase, IS30 family
LGNRHRDGHWQQGLPREPVSLVERMTGLLLIGKLEARTTASLNRRVIRMIKRHAGAFQTVTADNGTEFHNYQRIEACTKALFYFARPYHSWERGSNENANGLIRQYLPKGTSLAGLSQHQCNSIARKLNTRPRKRLGFRTPLECYHDS